VVYVDDGGLLKEPKYFFQIAGCAQPYAGRGLILGTNESGDDMPAKILLETTDGQRLVSFPKLHLKGFKTNEGKENHPVFGEMTVTNIEAVFEDAS
jgi:hypothetical protein